LHPKASGSGFDTIRNIRVTKEGDKPEDKSKIQ
jgi:hypothetical protein